MFSTNASIGENIPATSTRCFDILSTLSFVPRVPSRSGSVLDRNSNKKVYTTIGKILAQLAKVRFSRSKIRAAGQIAAIRKPMSC
jgi:hypothetical protein